MATIGSIAINISASTEALSKGLNKAAAEVKGFGAEINSLGGIASKAFLGIGAAVAGFASIGAAADFIRDSVEAASSLSSAVNGARAVFGDAAGAITSEAQRLADQFSVVKSEFTSAAVSLGLTFKAAGKGQADAAALGNAVAKLGLDLAAFNDTSNAEAFTALQAAFRGEFDPLERFKVQLSAAAVTNEALRLGLARSKAEVSDGAKKLATYSLLLERSRDQQGSLAREAGETGSKIRSFGDAITNIKADIGLAIEPATNAFVTLANVGVKAVSDAIVRNRAEINAWAAEAAASIKGLADGTSDFGNTVGILGTAFGWLFREVRAVFTLFQSGIAASTALTARFIDGIRNAGVSIANTFGAGLSAGPGFFGNLAEEAERTRDVYWQTTKDLALGTRRATEAIDGQAAAVKRVAAAAPALAALSAPMDQAAAATSKAADEAERLQEIQQTWAADAAALTEKFRTPLQVYQQEVAKVQTMLGKGLISKDTAGGAFKAAFEELNAPAIEARKRLEDEAKSVRESIATPFEKFQAERQKLTTLLGAGLLKPEEFARAFEAARKDIGGSGGLTSGPKFAEALELGSKEARSAALAHRAGGTADPMRNLDKTNKDQLAVQRQTLMEIRRLAANSKPLEILSLP